MGIQYEAAKSKPRTRVKAEKPEKKPKKDRDADRDDGQAYIERGKNGEDDMLVIELPSWLI